MVHCLGSKVGIKGDCDAIIATIRQGLWQLSCVLQTTFNTSVHVGWSVFCPTCATVTVTHHNYLITYCNDLLECTSLWSKSLSN